MYVLNTHYITVGFGLEAFCLTQTLLLPLLQLILSSNVILSHTEVAPTKRQGKFITYGAYSNTPAWSSQPFSVHFENNSPFARATKLVRELEVSHWGNVYVDEKYYIRYAISLHSEKNAKTSLLSVIKEKLMVNLSFPLA